MIFSTIYESAQKGELILIDGGYCRYHVRRDGQLTIHEIIATHPGAGSTMLATLKTVPATSIVAKCPAELKSNAWYAKQGFVKEAVEQTRTGKDINVWRLSRELFFARVATADSWTQQ